ncbi:MAG: hypothetical protein A3C06_01110 [Candidatus Taylorbacteria bacterium RIFCSPHIGHO2_02_FULL_46_13]|uniref:EfeO-type cupredoxin-like domain-containing protein n=1 Tax=Candidatus Taylorbacteria bacterium RIFCSPHIGHO2_02_FULL_46_13 TaxID=1802312 RepID=A0A1G2MVU3_9BACT|nr:MAG: hypothetical protein A3C06_01110 [Candidatus Taylorbacteria bacterium RIFCSPHIGHO2_02_FULL_46_13]
MSKNAIVTIVVLIVLVMFGWFLFSGKQAVAPVETNQEVVTTPMPASSSTPATSEMIKTEMITYTDDGFSPSLVTIKVGDTVEFKNASSVDFWPASAMHPTHTVYPGSDIKKCDTSAEAGIFDACKNYAPGASWSFTFTNKGTWAYHNHLNSRQFGKITVE